MKGDEDSVRSHSLSRRRFLRAGVSTLVGSLATTSIVDPVAARSEGLENWFEGVSNYDGIVDKTGQSEVTVAVGAQGNNGYFAFDPPAIRVDPGTKVVWEWTGKGGQHNVVSTDGNTLESDLVNEKGHTYTHTFDQTGIYKYVCQPHKSLGMKGAVVVGDLSAGERSIQEGRGGLQLFRDMLGESLFISIILSILGLTSVIVVLPDLPAAQRAIARGVTRAGYRVKQHVHFRRRPLGSQLVGWSTFLVLLSFFGVVLVSLWVVSGGGIAFIGGLAVLASLLVLYAVSNTGVELAPRSLASPTAGNSSRTASRVGMRSAGKRRRSRLRSISEALERVEPLVRGWVGVFLLLAVGAGTIVVLWYVTGGGVVFLAVLFLLGLILAGYAVTTTR